MRAIVGGMDFILGKPEAKQKVFKKIALELRKAHALCAATDKGKAKALEVSYFKAVKASLAKLSDKHRPTFSKQEVEARVHQMLERSVISEDIIDVFDTLGVKRPEISILSEEFLKEVQEMNHNNLAMEMLKKLLEGNLKALEKYNLVKAEKFSERLQKALNQFRNQALTNAEAIEKLIRMAHDIKKMRQAEKWLGMYMSKSIGMLLYL